jgi:hypothetical protein
MAAEGKSTKWGRIADLSTTPVYAGFTAGMLDAGAGANIIPGGTINGQGTIGTMGHFCVFRHDGGTEADWTEPFDFPINGDFTIAINSSGEDLSASTTMDVSVQGSVDGTNYVDLHTDLIDGVVIDETVVAGVYDYDAKGRMPYMRLELTAGTVSTAENILIHVIPH